MNEYQEKLKTQMDKMVHLVYDLSNRFPKSELYCSVSQLKRATMSVILNYIEGYARNRLLVRLNFLQISFGSLKEAKYLVLFARNRQYMSQSEYDDVSRLLEEIAAMLWSEISHLKAKVIK